MSVKMKKTKIIDLLANELVNQFKIIHNNKGESINVLFSVYLQLVIGILKEKKYEEYINDVDKLFILDPVIKDMSYNIIKVYMKEETIQSALKWFISDFNFIKYIDKPLTFGDGINFKDILLKARILWIKEQIYNLVGNTLNIGKLSLEERI